MNIKVLQIVHHRNGICGAPFDVVKFDWKDDEDASRQMVGIVFAEPGTVAIFDLDLLTDGDIAFGSNSWRGDNFEADLRDVIKKEEENLPWKKS